MCEVVYNLLPPTTILAKSPLINTGENILVATIPLFLLVTPALIMRGTRVCNFLDAKLVIVICNRFIIKFPLKNKNND